MIHERMFFLFPSHKRIDFMIIISLIRNLRGLAGPGNQSRRILKRLSEDPLSGTWSVVVQLVFVTCLAVLHPRT